jgi:N-acetylmuramic acid 6-phosphate etherase
MNTEDSSKYDKLETYSTAELLQSINELDSHVSQAVQQAIPQIEALCDHIVEKMALGGRIFYCGSGTSGRLGIVDASECPPTYGVAHGLVIGIIAGGDKAIRQAVENAEDDTQACIVQLQAHNIGPHDVLIGISASGRTPYVLGGMQACNALGITTACIVCNANSAIAQAAKFPVEIITGPEFVRGSTRMKAGTGTKLALNMITTTVFIKRGHVQGNKMVDMQLSNDKLIDRGTRMIVEETGMPYPQAKALLLKHKSVRAAIDNAH